MQTKDLVTRMGVAWPDEQKVFPNAASKKSPVAYWLGFWAFTAMTQVQSLTGEQGSARCMACPKIYIFIYFYNIKFYSKG